MDDIFFLADRTVGQLAKWLRLTGFDCAYNDSPKPAEVLKQARNEHRLILTKNTRLAACCEPDECLFIEADRSVDQLKYVLTKLNLSIDNERVFTICSLCNERLLNRAREEVRGLVPPYVFAHQEQYRQCPRCQRLYWGGTHKARMIERLDAIFSLSKQGKDV
ncbi:MAG: hypothetical protein GX444_09170 [Myxococcales bacterium]|nr:hypothetical protein [Myxococcales bacterium]